jgi:hypothetical protein
MKVLGKDKYNAANHRKMIIILTEKQQTIKLMYAWRDGEICERM